MFSILVYDIPSDDNGTKRRQKIYDKCRSLGYHVQDSVFEFTLDYAKMHALMHEIEKIMNEEDDSVRLYIIGSERTEKNTIVLGRACVVESDNPMILF